MEKSRDTVRSNNRVQRLLGHSGNQNNYNMKCGHGGTSTVGSQSYASLEEHSYRHMAPHTPMPQLSQPWGQI